VTTTARRTDRCWIPSRRAGTGEAAPAERHIPVPAVVGHGLLAVITLVLVLLTALGIGES
jgi:hypothetical protein